ncbi:hypothetical protein HGD85_02940 [Rhodobacteraceae bacterium R_SAG10]|nr:hypothetical protein [Rhodobacteraceae bacterium R_SAG10]
MTEAKSIELFEKTRPNIAGFIGCRIVAKPTSTPVVAVFPLNDQISRGTFIRLGHGQNVD